MSTRFNNDNKGVITLVPGQEGRQRVQLTNRVQTTALTLELTLPLTVAGAAADVTRRSEGRVSNFLMLTPINENGTDMVGEIAARDFRLLGESEAGQAFPSTLLPAGAGAVVNGSYTIREIIKVNFAHPLAVDPFETSYMEADPNSPVFCEARWPGGIAALVATLVNSAGAAVITPGNLTIQVIQHYDPARTRLPLFTPRIRSIANQTVAGANSDDLFRLPTRQRVRALIFRQQAQLASGGRLIVSDVFNSLRLIGDDGRNVIGPAQETFRLLRDGQAAVQGGQIAEDTYVHSFQRAGRLSYTVVPERDYPNFRAEINDQPSVAAGAVSSQGVATIVELIARPPVNGYATVMPRVLADGSRNPDFPDWAF